MIKQRKCRRYYGIASADIFDPRKHEESEAWVDEYDGRKRADGQMNWLIKRGQDLSTSELGHAKLPLHMNFWPEEERTSSINLLAFNDTKAPKRRSDPVSSSKLLLWCQSTKSA